ncbi:serine protease, partial [Actibacterium sp.]|uniref:serine protease n=1 Tax=Actibacterium sp. TaxID=1872125 RepID=UPI003562E9BC
MRQFFSVIFLVFLGALPAAAQDRVWLQIEAQPTLRQAQDAARGYASTLTDVNGFQLKSGWYAIALGPYPADDAPDQLRALRRQGQVPRDAYIADGRNFTQQFWPVGGAATAVPLTAPEPVAPVAATPAVTPVQPAPVETLNDSRRAEAALSRDEKMEIQEALKWDGFYDSSIDGAFGSGTRRAISAYQEAMGYEPTGVLSTRQQAELIGGYRAEFAALGLKTIDDVAAGLRITLPASKVEFSRYEPPFVHYDSRNDSGVRVLLISQKGDQDTLFGLYDIMQTLEIVPLNGARERGRTSFTLTGQNAEIHSYTYAALEDGMIKGFTLIWRPEDEKLMRHVAQVMQDSLTPYGDSALDEMLGTGDSSQNPDLMSGLEIRRPGLTRSGFYVDGKGTVLTTVEVLNQCQRITIGDDLEVRLEARDDTLGLAVLRPAHLVSPLAYAAFQTGIPRLKSEVAVAGYSYGDALTLPVLTYGTLADLRGLGGEDGLNRLDMTTLPGDAGGPV